MSQPNFRALCADLVNELHGYKALHPEHGTDLIDLACRELATPPPEPLRPIPVSERLPGERDCIVMPTESSDAGWCWVYTYESWSFSPVVFPMPHLAQPRVLLNRGTTHWLPSNAIPLPEVTQ